MVGQLSSWQRYRRFEISHPTLSWSGLFVAPLQQSINSSIRPQGFYQPFMASRSKPSIKRFAIRKIVCSLHTDTINRWDVDALRLSQIELRNRWVKIHSNCILNPQTVIMTIQLASANHQTSLSYRFCMLPAKLSLLENLKLKAGL